MPNTTCNSFSSPPASCSVVSTLFVNHLLSLTDNPKIQAPAVQAMLSNRDAQMHGADCSVQKGQAMQGMVCSFQPPATMTLRAWEPFDVKTPLRDEHLLACFAQASTRLQDDQHHTEGPWRYAGVCFANNPKPSPAK